MKLTWQEKENAVKDAIARFPKTFKVKAYDGEFRVSPYSCFYSDDSGVQIIIQRLNDGGWMDFCREDFEVAINEVVK